jgi:mannitol 2-dehydrogenase
LAPLRRYLERFLETEAIPTLDEIPGHPAVDYASTVLSRFTNSGVRDQIARLCIDGTAKFPSFLIPTIERQLELGGPVECAAFALAGWARYLAVTPPAERAPDPHGERAVALALRALDQPLTFLELDDVFPAAIRDSARFRQAFARAGRSLAEDGSVPALERLLA